MTQQPPAQPQGNEDQIMKSQMEQMVDTYDSYMKKVTLGREHILRQVTIELAGIKPGDRVLEVGCGTGTLTLAAKQKAGPSGQVFGIDLIPGMIAASQAKAAQAGAEITFQEGSIANIPFPGNYFDVVMGSFMIFHMSAETRRRGIAETQRVLKSGGRLMLLDLATPERPLQRAIAKAVFGGMLEHDLRELIPLLEAAGFTTVEYGLAKFRLLGLSVIGYVRGNAKKM